MSEQAVLEAVRRVIVATPGMRTGYAGIPENAPSDEKLPAGLAYHDFERDGEIVHGGLEEWSYPVRVDLLIQREGDFQQELPAVMTLLEGFVAQLRAHATLWGVAFLHADASYRLQQMNIFNAIYVGASWRGTFGVQLDVAAQYQP